MNTQTLFLLVDVSNLLKKSRLKKKRKDEYLKEDVKLS